MANGGSSGASRRESMDRGSSTFSPSLSEQYKNKAAAVNAAAGAGWPTSYGALGAGKSYFLFSMSNLGCPHILAELEKPRDFYNVQLFTRSSANSKTTNPEFSLMKPRSRKIILEC